MNLAEFVEQIPGLVGQTHVEKIKLFGWYLHAFSNRERFDQAAIRECYDLLHWAKPSNVSPLLTSLIEKRPPELLKDSRGYRLEGRVRSHYDVKYGRRQSAIAVDKMLAELPDKIPDISERAFLGEALACFRARAFRATIVMAWNLAFDHVLRWILKDASRLSSFNLRVPIRFPKKTGLVIARQDDFEDLKESEVIEICNSAGLFSSNVFKILKEKLDRRNMAAHPSTVEVAQVQAEDVVTDLVTNVILRLT